MQEVLEDTGRGDAMIRTRFTELFQCRVPIMNGAMAGTAGGRLAAAVARSGGLPLVSTPKFDAINCCAFLAPLPAFSRHSFRVSSQLEQYPLHLKYMARNRVFFNLYSAIKLT